MQPVAVLCCRAEVFRSRSRTQPAVSRGKDLLPKWSSVAGKLLLQLLQHLVVVCSHQTVDSHCITACMHDKVSARMEANAIYTRHQLQGEQGRKKASSGSSVASPQRMLKVALLPEGSISGTMSEGVHGS